MIGQRRTRLAPARGRPPSSRPAQPSRRARPGMSQCWPSAVIAVLAPTRRRALYRRDLWRRRLQPGPARRGAVPGCRHRPRSRGGAARPRIGAGLDGRLTLVEGNFGDMERLVAPVAGGPHRRHRPRSRRLLVQLDRPARGFSFRFDGPLDMRMSGAGQSAADLVAAFSEEELAQLIRDLRRGAVRAAALPARSQPRGSDRPIRRTVELADIVARRHAPSRAGARPGDPDLSGAAHRGQRRARRARPRPHRGRNAADAGRPAGGGLVSFAGGPPRQGVFAAAKRHRPARLAPRPRAGRRAGAELRSLGRRAARPDAAEIARNPRARSARLRAAVRTAAPSWPADCRGQAA